MKRSKVIYFIKDSNEKLKVMEAITTVKKESHIKKHIVSSLGEEEQLVGIFDIVAL